MRKIPRLSITSSVIMFAFIVPQVAFAAWWNPLSWFNGWGFFYRTDNQTQVLENRIKELEKKLGSTATSSAMSTTTTVTKNTPQIVSQKTMPVVAETKKDTSPTKQTQIISKDAKLEISNVRAIPSAYKISILWNTNRPSDGKVTLWPTETASGNIVANTTNTTSHQVEIQTIPRKTYYYLIESDTTEGQIASSEQKEITTPSDNVVPIINSVTSIRPTSSSIDFNVVASEPVKLTLQYNYSTLMEGEGAFMATSTDVFSENSHISVRMPDGYFPLTSVISVKITAYDQSLNSSIQYKRTVKIADITTK